MVVLFEVMQECAPHIGIGGVEQGGGIGFFGVKSRQVCLPVTWCKHPCVLVECRCLEQDGGLIGSAVEGGIIQRGIAAALAGEGGRVDEENICYCVADFFTQRQGYTVGWVILMRVGRPQVEAIVRRCGRYGGGTCMCITLLLHGAEDMKSLPSPIWAPGVSPLWMSAKACEIKWGLYRGVPDAPPTGESRTCAGAVVEVRLEPLGAAKLHLVDLPVMRQG